MSEREDLIRGILNLARFLIDHPEVDFPTEISASARWGAGTSEETAIQRIEAWKAAGYTDYAWWSSPGNHGVNITFGGFTVRLSYVEDGAARPIAWGATPGESDKDFQRRVNEALVAADKPMPCPSWAETDGITYAHTYHRCQHVTQGHPDRHVCECGYEWYDFQAGDRT